MYLCNYPSFGINSSHLDENGSGNRTGACDDDNLLTSFNNRWDTCNVQFNAISFINSFSRLFVRFLVLSFLPSFILILCNRVQKSCKEGKSASFGVRTQLGPLDLKSNDLKGYPDSRDSTSGYISSCHIYN